MNREIKFRAWLVDGMFDWGELRNDYADVFEDGLSGERDVILMQYTGLKDKNGKEIYEGDILECINLETEDKDFVKEYGLKRYEHVYWFNDHEEVGFSVCDPLKDDYDAFDALNVGPCAWSYEVIGNIYENPELLKTIGGNF